MSAMKTITQPKVYVATCELGKGIFAGQAIRRGEVILTFVGPIVSGKDCVAQGAAECVPIQIGHDKYLDPVEPGCYTNHSCTPNAGITKRRILIALVDIRQDEEIRFDYSTTMEGDSWTMVCKCNGSSCRKIVGNFSSLSPLVQEKYLALGIVQDFIVRGLGSRAQKQTEFERH